MENIQSPFFTIVVVSFNAEQEIEETIQSILNQDFKDYEILVKDAGSTDSTVTKIPKDRHIRIVQCSDKGIYDGMNQAIALAKGKFINFMNCGDRFYQKTTLSRVYEVAIKYIDEPIVLYGNAINKGDIFNISSQYTDSYAYNHTICHQAMFYNELIFRKYGVYNTAFKIAADYEHAIRIKRKYNVQFIHTKETIAYYKGGGYSETRQNAIRCISEREQVHRQYYSRREQALIEITISIRSFIYSLIPKQGINLYEKYKAYKIRTGR